MVNKEATANKLPNTKGAVSLRNEPTPAAAQRYSVKHYESDECNLKN